MQVDKKEVTLIHATDLEPDSNELLPSRSVMLTTIDNPFNPFTDFDNWQKFDESKSYFTCEYLARIAATSDELSEVDEDLAILQAIDEIIKLNVLGIYKKVTM